MLLSTGWRENVQNQLLERKQEDGMNHPDKIKAIVDQQFDAFCQPIMALTSVSQEADFYRYKAYDRAMDVEYGPDKITFHQVMFSADGREIKKTATAELIFNGSVFVHSIKDSQSNEYINTAKIESIMQQSFTLGIAVRF